MSPTPISDRVKAKVAVAMASTNPRAWTLAREADMLLLQAEEMKATFYGPRQVAVKLAAALKRAERAELVAMGGR